MDRDLFNSLTTLALAIVGIAGLALLVSRNSNTGGVLDAYGNMFSNMVGAADAPVTGGSSMYGGYANAGYGH